MESHTCGNQFRPSCSFYIFILYKYIWECVCVCTCAGKKFYLFLQEKAKSQWKGEGPFSPFLTRGKHRCLLALKDCVCVCGEGGQLLSTFPDWMAPAPVCTYIMEPRYLELTSDLSVGLSFFSLFNGRQWTISGRVVSLNRLSSFFFSARKKTKI